MAITLRRLIRVVALLLVVFLVVVIAGGVYFRGRMRASLPMLDGTLAVDGLDAAVTIERDALGVPTIHAQSTARTPRAPSVFCTRRIASSRWICSVVRPPASCRRSWAPARSMWIAPRACTAFAR